MLCDAEDHDACRVCVNILFSMRQRTDFPYTDAFVDCKVLDALKTLEGLDVQLHRCLQHVRSNVKAAGKVIDKKRATRDCVAQSSGSRYATGLISLPRSMTTTSSIVSGTASSRACVVLAVLLT